MKSVDNKRGPNSKENKSELGTVCHTVMNFSIIFSELFLLGPLCESPSCCYTVLLLLPFFSFLVVQRGVHILFYFFVRKNTDRILMMLL